MSQFGLSQGTSLSAQRTTQQKWMTQKQKEEKLSGIELELIQADVHRMTGITTAPYEQNPKPFQQIDEH